MLDHWQNCILTDSRHTSSLLMLVVIYPILRTFARYLPQSLVTPSVFHVYFYIRPAVFFWLALAQQIIYVSTPLLTELRINLSWCSVSAHSARFHMCFSLASCRHQPRSAAAGPSLVLWLHGVPILSMPPTSLCWVFCFHHWVVLPASLYKSTDTPHCLLCGHAHNSQN